MRPESCLCEAAGSGNTGLHCEAMSRTHARTHTLERTVQPGGLEVGGGGGGWGGGASMRLQNRYWFDRFA